MKKSGKQDLNEQLKTLLLYIQQKNYFILEIKNKIKILGVKLFFLFLGPIRSYPLKENHIGSVVSKILPYIQTDR